MKEDNVSRFISACWPGLWLCLPLYPYYSSNGGQVCGCNVFELMRTHGITWDQGLEMLDTVHQYRNKLMKSNLGNSGIYLVRDASKFKFLASQDSAWSKGGWTKLGSGGFSLWDDQSRSLGHFKIDHFSEPPTAEFCKWIDDLTKDYCAGYVYCSQCRRRMHKTEVAGMFFAGVYCKECWDGGVAAEAARETYD